MTLRGRGWVLPGLEGAEAGAAPCRLNGSLRMGGVLESACRALGGWQDPWPPGSFFTQCSGQEPQSMDTSSPPSSLRTSPSLPEFHPFPPHFPVSLFCSPWEGKGVIPATLPSPGPVQPSPVGPPLYLGRWDPLGGGWALCFSVLIRDLQLLFI